MNIPKIFIFNFLTKRSFNTLQVFGRRLNSISMDFSFILGMVFPFYGILFIPFFIIIARSTNISISSSTWIGILPFSFITFLMINKDFYNAKSIAKRHFGYQVVDIKTNKPANQLQCVIRNSTMIIWPIEVIISIFNSKKRLGDLIAGTKLIDVDKEDPELIMNEIHQKINIKNKSKFIWVSIFISLLFSILSSLSKLLNLI